MPRQPQFSPNDIVAAGLRIVRNDGLEAVSARALGKEFGLRLVAFAKEDPNVFQMLFLGKDSRTEIAESILRTSRKMLSA